MENKQSGECLQYVWRISGHEVVILYAPDLKSRFRPALAQKPEFILIYQILIGPFLRCAIDRLIDWLCSSNFVDC